jgi:molybdopterin molybdotransferase
VRSHPHERCPSNPVSEYNSPVPTLSFEDARRCVLDTVQGAPGTLDTETVPLLRSPGRVLAQNLAADRDYPPTARSVRDGYALQASRTPGTFRVIGEARAGGDPFPGVLNPGEAIEIMTGAPMPSGADAVLMVEHGTLNESVLHTERQLKPGENFNPQACEARQGETVITPGNRLQYTGIALAATYGCYELSVYKKPIVAILATGDEIVDDSGTHPPLPHQIRNSNSWALAAQVERAGGIPQILPVARDNFESTRILVAEGLKTGLFLLSGGVSAGKYDLVERVLSTFGAHFYFDRIAIQPGAPLVFGKAQGTFFFGLPGNPSSAMITFELFARAALDLLGGVKHPELFLPQARLTRPFHHRAGLTRFLPAFLETGGITPLPWSGSSDVAAMARANAYLVADPGRAEYAAGDLIRVLLK